MVKVDPHRVAEIIRSTAEEVILPRFCCLTSGQVKEKGPGDLVTIADTEAEQLLTRRLTELLPGSLVVGEESVAADAKVLDRLSGEAPVWIIDPVDGTRNFAHGRPKFAVIVALVARGKTVQGWIHDPLEHQTYVAEQGAGCHDQQGTRLTVAAAPAQLSELRGSIGNRKMDAVANAVAKMVRQGSAAHDYIDLILGRLHFTYYKRLRPWDHAAGILMHAEAGGVSRLFNGEPYRPVYTEQAILMAPDADSWERIRALFP